MRAERAEARAGADHPLVKRAVGVLKTREPAMLLDVLDAYDSGATWEQA